MKIWCDVCDKEEASVFCSADEAALCNSCDRHVHHANKLASKHLRFSLLSPNFKESAVCDICKERRALLFCQEDRAILCRECDIQIHQINEHTQKHNRFLLTGIKLSSSPSLYQSNIHTEPAKNRTNSVSTQNFSKRTSPSSGSSEIFDSPSTQHSISNYFNGFDDNSYQLMSDSGSVCTGSISEYLMETLPGWRVEDLLDHSSSGSNNGFLTAYGEDYSFS